MARYFYDHSVGVNIIRDGDGIVCRDDSAAIRNGQIALSSLLSKHQHLLPWQHFEIIVRREDGAVVGRMGMTLVVETQNPATVAGLANLKIENDRETTIRP